MDAKGNEEAKDAVRRRMDVGSLRFDVVEGTVVSSSNGGTEISSTARAFASDARTCTVAFPTSPCLQHASAS